MVEPVGRGVRCTLVTSQSRGSMCQECKDELPFAAMSWKIPRKFMGTCFRRGQTRESAVDMDYSFISGAQVRSHDVFVLE